MRRGAVPTRPAVPAAGRKRPAEAQGGQPKREATAPQPGPPDDWPEELREFWSWPQQRFDELERESKAVDARNDALRKEVLRKKFAWDNAKLVKELEELNRRQADRREQERQKWEAAEREREQERERELAEVAASVAARKREISEIPALCEREIAEINAQIEEKKQNVQRLAEANAQLQQEMVVRAAAKEAANQQRDAARDARLQAEARLAAVRARCDELRAAKKQSISRREQALEVVARIKAELNKHEDDRRKMHNRLEDLKGNIRVLCRIRAATDEREIAEWKADPGQPELQIKGRERSAVSSAKEARADTHSFRYDCVFGPDSTQAQLFDQVSPLIQSCLDGYHVCIFAYGQTGSGKTYTMEGAESGAKDLVGVIPRSVDKIFETLQRLQMEHGFTAQLSVSFLEIYLEQVYDLLAQHDGKKAAPELRVRTVDSEVEVEGLSRHPVGRPDDVHRLLAVAQKNRQCAETQMNARSSRSHSIFQLHVSSHDPASGQRMKGVLNLIDLAGSERLMQSKAEGIRKREAQSINTSLSHLATAIAALGNKSGSHVPFRNSALTMLLKPSLVGSAKIMMVVNCSPYKEHVDETLCSLRFASRVNATKVGQAKRDVDDTA